MCIFLSLGDTCLFKSILCKEFTKCIGNLFFYKCHKFIFNCHIVLCKAYECCLNSLASVKAFKFIIAKCSCNFSRTVWTEIKEDDGIIFFDCCKRSSIFFNNCWQNKLICCIFIIRCLDSGWSACCLFAFSVCNCTVCLFYTIPAIITIHRIIPSHNRRYFTNTYFFHLSF